MEFQNSNLFISWKYYSAPTPSKLEELLLRLQIQSKKPLKTTSPTHVDGKWTVWVLYDWSNEIRPSDKLKMESK